MGILTTYNVHQHSAFFDSSNTSSDRNKHQTNGYDHHERCRCEEMVIHEDAEVIKNRIDRRPDSH